MSSLKQIAKELHVSVATVSNALNNTGRIGDQLKRRIVETAEKKNYRPSVHARVLHGKRLSIIGLIVPGMRDGFCQHLFDGAEQVAREHGYDLLFAISRGKLENNLSAMRRFSQLHIAGVIFQPSMNEDSGVIHKEAEKLLLPHVVTYRRSMGDPSPGVLVDFALGVQLGLRHLAELGHKKVAFLHQAGASGQEHIIARSIVPGFCDTIGMKGVTSSAPNLEYLLRTGITGIFCDQDSLANKSIERIREFGMSVPTDVSVLGFRDSLEALVGRPALTTIHVPMFDIGASAANLLIQRIGDDAEKANVSPSRLTAELPPHLVVRESTATAPQAKAPKRTVQKKRVPAKSSQR